MKKHPQAYPSHKRRLRKLPSPEREAVSASGFIIHNEGADTPKEDVDFIKDLVSVLAPKPKSPSRRSTRSGESSSSSIRSPPIKKKKQRSRANLKSTVAEDLTMTTTPETTSGSEAESVGLVSPKKVESLPVAPPVAPPCS